MPSPFFLFPLICWSVLALERDTFRHTTSLFLFYFYSCFLATPQPCSIDIRPLAFVHRVSRIVNKKEKNESITKQLGTPVSHLNKIGYCVGVYHFAYKEIFPRCWTDGSRSNRSGRSMFDHVLQRNTEYNQRRPIPPRLELRCQVAVDPNSSRIV